MFVGEGAIATEQKMTGLAQMAQLVNSGANI
jgi:hypothetical protein